MLRDPEGIEYKVIRKLLGPTAGDVLEVGCGDGRLTGEISAFADSVVGLDPDPGSIDKAHHLLGSGIRLILGSGESIPLEDNSIDTVVFSLSLHHHQNSDNALAEARRVLRERGRVLVLEPRAESAINQLFKIIHDEDDAYDKAAAAINMCSLATADKGTYETLWRFDDFDEMVENLFGYFDMEPDRKIIDRMTLLLEDRRDSIPLDMTDITRYWLLDFHSGGEDQVP